MQNFFVVFHRLLFSFDRKKTRILRCFSWITNCERCLPLSVPSSKLHPVSVVFKLNPKFRSTIRVESTQQHPVSDSSSSSLVSLAIQCENWIFRKVRLVAAMDQKEEEKKEGKWWDLRRILDPSLRPCLSYEFFD